MQLTVKVAVIVVYKKQLKQILDDMDQFWILETVNAEDDVELKKRNEFLEKVCWITAFVYRIMGYTLMIAYTGNSIVNKTTPFACWMPQDDPIPYFFQIVYVTQMLILVTVIPFVVGFDCLFAAICIKIAIQFRILCRAINTAVPSDVTNVTDAEKVFIENIRKCIVHQQFLYRSHTTQILYL